MKVVVYVTFFLKLFLGHLRAATAQRSSCPVRQYSGTFRAKDCQEDKAIFGHSYKNFTVRNPQECFSYCTSDCKCMSYQIYDGTRCELVDEDRDTAQVEAASGYHFYHLKQTMKASVAIPCAECRNSCCRNNPCMNGGTCAETCQTARQKFKCICPFGIQGKYCQFIVSCAGIPGKPSTGVHTITRPSLTSQVKVYCDFTTELNFVWTLVESLAYSKKMDYYYWKFFENHPVNESSPNWVDYRLSLEDMTHIRTNATHWRVTCNYESANWNISTSDYVRVDMNTRDIMQSVSSSCHYVDFLRLLGTTCAENCKTLFRHDSYHPYFTPCFDQSCKFVGCPGNTFEAFGAYEIVNNDHHCSASQTSTTNWWFGYELK